MIRELYVEITEWCDYDVCALTKLTDVEFPQYLSVQLAPKKMRKNSNIQVGKHSSRGSKEPQGPQENHSQSWQKMIENLTGECTHPIFQNWKVENKLPIFFCCIAGQLVDFNFFPGVWA